jgi:hypothetical protein
MRKIILFAILMLQLSAAAQTGLGIPAFGTLTPSDTVSPNTNDSYEVWLKNYGSTGFNDTVNFFSGIRDSISPSGLDSVISFSGNNVLSLAPGDSSLITLNNIYNVSSGSYRYGINVIVVWPVANSAITVDSLEYTVFIIDPNSIGEVSISELLKAYPNPASDRITIERLDHLSILRIKLYDVSGKLLLSEDHENNICIESLPAGMYNLEVITNNKKLYIMKIIKK